MRNRLLLLLLLLPTFSASPLRTPAASAAPPPSFSAVAAGGHHTCALTTSKTVFCWGDNSLGQLGLGSRQSSLYPSEVPSLSNITSLALGESHSCALDASGSVFCWGRNRYGEAGTNGFRKKYDVLSPKKVPFPSSAKPVKSIAAGSKHTCATDTSGSVFCWGYNAFGQLGTGSVKTAWSPAKVLTVPAASQVALGSMHTCAIASSALWCWGRLGAGSSFAVPQKVTALQGTPSSLALGTEHTCVVVSGSVLCAGRFNISQTGQPPSPSSTTTTTLPQAPSTTAKQKTTTTTSSPTASSSPSVVSSWQKISAFSGASQVSARGDTSCALVSGSLWCWGSNRSNQILASPALYSQPLKLAPLPSPVSSLAVGTEHVCVVASSAVLCWGNNLSGQIGLGSLSRASSPKSPVFL